MSAAQTHTDQRQLSSGSLSSMTATAHPNEGDNDQAYPTEKTDEEKGAAPAPPMGSEAPDGGMTAWLVVLGCWCTSFCSFGWINSVGAFQEYYQTTLLKSYTPSEISWIPSLQIFFMNGMGPIVGTLYDKYGPRYLLLFGTLMHVFGLMMASLGTRYYELLLAQGVCSAIGVSAIFQPSINCIHGWFNKKRGAAFGILATGSSLGGVIFPIMVSRLIREVGYPWAMRICAFLILALCAVANFTVKPRVMPTPQKITKAQLAAPFREIDYIFLCLGFFCFTFGIFVPINYLPVQALDAGMDVNLVSYLIPILNAASLFGRLFAGIMGDRIGKYNMFVIVGALTGLWVLALWIPANHDGGIIAFALLFGFCSGAYVSLIAPLVAQISPMREIGFRTGIIFALAAIPGLTTNPISGQILGPDNYWVGVKIFAGVFCLLGTAFIMASRVKRTGWKLAVVF